MVRVRISVFQRIVLRYMDTQTKAVTLVINFRLLEASIQFAD